jgi:hypothetical protein
MTHITRIPVPGRHSAPSILSRACDLKIVGFPEVEDFRKMIFNEASKNIPPKMHYWDVILGAPIFDFENHDMKDPRSQKKNLKSDNHFLDVYNLLYALPVFTRLIENRELYSVLSKPFVLNNHKHYMRCVISSDKPEAYILSEQKVMELSRTNEWILAYPF